MGEDKTKQDVIAAERQAIATYKVVINEKAEFEVVAHGFPKDVPAFLILVRPNKKRVFVNISTIRTMEMDASAFTEIDKRIDEDRQKKIAAQSKILPIQRG